MITRYGLVALAAGLAVAVSGCGEQEEPAAVELETLDQKVSYVFGLNVARSSKNEGIELDVEALAQGMNDIYSDTEQRLSDDEIQEVMAEYQEIQQERMAEQQAEQAKEREAQAQANREAGEAFLTENAQKEGVVTTDSGLQYKVIEEGDGASPSAGDKVTVHYTGKLIDGTVFDSSRERDQPFTFELEGVIPGWIEGIQLMNEGGKYELYIPSDLAYGQRGQGPTIGPNATLVFEVEVLDVEAAPAAEAEEE